MFMKERIVLNVPRRVVLMSVLISCVLFELFIFYLNGIKQVHIEVMKYELMAFYFSILLYSFKKLGAFNLYVIFLYTTFVFLYGRIFFDLFDEWDWNFGNHFDDVYFPLNTQFEILSLLIVSLLFVHLGYLYNRDSRMDNELDFKFESWPELEKWALFFFVLALPGIICKYWMELQVILQNGYLAVYDGTLDNLEYPIWTAGTGTIFVGSYAVFISARPDKRKFIIVSSVFFLLNLLNTLKGARSKVFVPLLYMLWLYFTFYKKKSSFPFYKLVLLVVVSVVFSQWMTVHRVGNTTFDTSDLAIIFFLQQGVSILVLGYMVFYKDIFINNGLPYVLAPLLTFGFGEGGQTFDLIQSTNLLGHKLTYFLSPISFYKGQGLGSSFLAELYDLGIIPLVLLCAFVGYFIAHWVKYAKNNRITFLLSYFVVQHIIFMPRSTFLPGLTEIIYCLFFYFFMTWLANHYSFKFIR